MKVQTLDIGVRLIREGLSQQVRQQRQTEWCVETSTQERCYPRTAPLKGSHQGENAFLRLQLRQYERDEGCRGKGVAVATRPTDGKAVHGQGQLVGKRGHEQGQPVVVAGGEEVDGHSGIQLENCLKDQGIEGPLCSQRTLAGEAVGNDIESPWDMPCHKGDVVGLAKLEQGHCQLTKGPGVSAALSGDVRANYSIVRQHHDGLRT